jgi:hypothetical protein
MWKARLGNFSERVIFQAFISNTQTGTELWLRCLVRIYQTGNINVLRIYTTWSNLNIINCLYKVNKLGMKFIETLLYIVFLYVQNYKLA